MPKEKSAGAIIFRKEDGKNYYLLLHYRPAHPGQKRGGHWEFAKGHIEGQEKEEETIIREVKEETGLSDIKIMPGFKEYIKYFFRKNYGLEGEARKKAPWVFKLVVFCVAETQTKEIKISDEHDNFIWLPFEDAFKKLTYKNAKEILKRANDFVAKQKI